MKISFFDDEPEIFPLQYGGKARTITNLAKEFIKLPDVEEVTILSKSINSNQREFIKDNVRYVTLNDENIMEMIAREIDRVDILNIHCCSFTFPNIEGKAKKMYFLHDVLIATAEKGSHLDKSLGGNFDAIIAPSEFAKSVYDKYRKIIKGKVDCYVIPRHINTEMFYDISKEKIKRTLDKPKLLNKILKDYKHILFFPSRPIEEKGGKYLIELAKKLNMKEKEICIIGPFSNEENLPENFIDTGWIESKDLKYYYSVSDVTLNFSELPESFSQVCLESAYCGTPVVAFESGNIPYLSRKIKNIFIVDKNIDKIKQGIEKAIKIKNDEVIKNKVKNEIIRTYGVEKIVNNYIKLYKKFMEE